MSYPVGHKASTDINKLNEHSGRRIKEDNTVINDAEAFDTRSNSNAVNLVDIAGRSVMATTFGQLATSQKDSQISEQFSYGLPGTGVISGVTGSGSVVPENSLLKFKTTTADGTAFAESLQALRYIPGSMAYCFWTMVGLPVGVAGTKAMGGAFDDEDGFAIGVIDGIMNVMRRRYNGVGDITEDLVPQTEWNIDKLDGTGPSKLDIDFTLGQVYSITYGYLGFAPIIFSIMAPNDGWVPFHRIEYPNSADVTNISLPYLPIRLEIDNTGSGASIEVGVGSMDVGIFNGGKTESSSKFEGINLGDLLITPKSFTGTDYIIALRGKAIYQGRKNKVSSLLKSISWATQDSVKSVTSDVIRDPDIVTPGTWVSLGDDSLLDYSIDTVYDLTTGTSTGLGASLDKDNSRPPNNLSDIASTLVRRGETLVIRIESTNGVVSDMFIAMQNLF